MRPIKLMITGFGPYAERTEIHMDALGEHGLYLITGDTGAGKTTIFDAITFALYGEASGNNREPVMLRSKYAEPGTATEVELTFAYGDHIYTVKRNPEYERPALRGTGMTKQMANAELIRPDGSVLTKRKEVDKAIQEILGVDRNQFSQIAMIAQGDFLKLLFAETKERQGIFREIFKTRNYQVLQERLKEESGALNKQCERERESVRQYIDGILYGESDVLAPEAEKAKGGQLPVMDVVKLLEQMLGQDTELIHQYEKDVKEIQEKLAVVNANLGRAEEYQKVRDALKIAEAKRQEMLPRREELQRLYEAEKAKEPQREALEREIAILEAEMKDYDAWEQKQSEVQAFEHQLKKDKALQEKDKLRQQELAKQLELYSTEYKLYEGAGEQREKLIREKEQAEGQQEAYQRVKEAWQQYVRLEKQLEQVQAVYMRESQQAAEQKQRYEAMSQAYLDEQAGVLAQGLEAGTPCPVCGSVTHPHPAKPSAKAPTKEQLETAKEQAEQAEQRQREASSNAGAIKGAVETQLENVEKQWCALKEEALPVITELEAQITERIGKQAALLTEYQKKISEEEKRIQRKNELATAIQDAEQQREKLQPELEELKEMVTAKEARLLELMEQVQERRGKLHYDNKVAAEAKHRELQGQKSNMKQRLEVAERNRNQCDREVTELDARIQQWQQQLKEAVNINIEEEQKLKVALGERNRLLSEQVRTVHTRITTNTAIIENIQKKSSELEALERKWTWVKALSNTANGNISGKEKIMLETYIQMTYFERIIARANTRLMIMTDGQYELKRRVATGDNRSQGGLELNVIDHYNGSERSVKTLSGGEAFQASLSLALGLSDEVQSSAGGIRLDTMFVDEGFGSLDEESLKQAIRALAELTEGNRLVGIISHVSELKERIDKQIVVTKEKSGGSRVEIVGN